MSRKEVRAYLLVYGVFTPWICVGLIFAALLYGGSYFFADPNAVLLRKIALVSLISAVIIGLVLSAVFAFRTRRTNRDNRH